MSHVNDAYLWNQYLKGLMSKLQNRARQWLFRERPGTGRCFICKDADVSAFFVSYGDIKKGEKPEFMWLCQVHHKEHSQHRGSVYDQLVRHGIEVISWEEWKAGKRPPRSKK